MISFKNSNNEVPFKVFKEKYDQASSLNQRSIEAISISSFSKDSKEVNSRFVNLKFVDNKEFIFFTNYNSPKSKEFKSHGQISALIYWNSINVQIRIKAMIKKTSMDFNKEYFKERSSDKNALAISSNQSSLVDSFEEVKDNFNKVLLTSNLWECPKNWGGFSFVPYYFEFWEGNESRLNKRDVYQIKDKIWEHTIIQP